MLSYHPDKVFHHSKFPVHPGTGSHHNTAALSSPRQRRPPKAPLPPEVPLPPALRTCCRNGRPLSARLRIFRFT